MASPGCFGQDNRVTSQNILLQIKMKYPEFSENFIEELLIKFGGNIDRVLNELNAKSNAYIYGQNINEIKPMAHGPMQDYTNRTTQLDVNHPSMLSMPISSSAYQPNNMSGNLTPEQLRFLNDNRRHALYNNIPVRTQTPSDLFLQRRTISDDSLSYRRQMQQHPRRDRATSDITDVVTVSRENQTRPNLTGPIMYNFPQTFMQTAQSPEIRITEIESNAENNKQQYHVQEENRYTPTQHIQIQIESYTRMHTKVKTLEHEVDRIRRQVQQEEDDINTSSKVQKNPTGRDIQQLQEEILHINSEILQALNELEKTKAEDKGSASSTPAISPYPRNSIDDIRAAIHAPISLPSHFNDTTPPRPHLSAPRFPHPRPTEMTSPQIGAAYVQSNLFNRQMTESPPPNYSDVINQIGDMQPRESDGSEDQWECSACTFKNHAELPSCEVCNQARVCFV